MDGSHSEDRAPLAAAPGQNTDQPRRRLSWKVRLLLATLLLTALVLFHAPLLRSVARLLVLEGPLVPTDAVVIVGRSGPYQSVPFDVVADLYHQGMVGAVVLIEDRSSRLVRTGILPTLESVVQRELDARRVPTRTLTVLAGEYRTGWDSAQALRDWLQEHPQAHVTLLCNQFGSRANALIVRTVLGTETAWRVHWRALPDSRFDVTNWWQQRHGIVAVLGSYIGLVHTYVVGEPAEQAARWDPDEFERTLRERADP
jgi:hypothetical protein